MSAPFELELAQTIAGEIMQKAAYEVSDLINGWSVEARVFLLASMRSILDAQVQMLDETDAKTYAYLIGHTQTITLPSSFDPRRNGGGT